MYAFINIFFDTFPQFSGRPLHLSGESYGVSENTISCKESKLTSLYMKGRYLPAFASYIYDQNTIAEAAGRSKINLKSVLIGNGITDIST